MRIFPDKSYTPIWQTIIAMPIAHHLYKEMFDDFRIVARIPEEQYIADALETVIKWDRNRE